MTTVIYTIAHKCGHTVDRKIVDTTRNSIDMKADALEKQVCPVCYSAKQQNKVEAKGSTLPALVGSEKQIAWAINLRNQIILRVDAYIADFIKRHGTALQEQMQADRAKMLTHNDAKFWIENRNGLQALQNA